MVIFGHFYVYFKLYSNGHFPEKRNSGCPIFQRRVEITLQKVHETVRRETGYIAFFVLLFSLLLQAVFLIIGKWDYTVLLGNLLSGSVAVLNFFLLGLTVQNAVRKEEKPARDLMKLSQTLRSAFLFLAALLGVLLPCFNLFSVLIPLFFPRIAIAFRPLVDRKKKDGSDRSV